MTKVVDYVVVLDDGVRVRHQHTTEAGEVTGFVVQLETAHAGRWVPVVRYDCAHGFAHVDKYDGKGRSVKVDLNLSFEAALTLAQWDINENWEQHISRFRG